MFLSNNDLRIWIKQTILANDWTANPGFVDQLCQDKNKVIAISSNEPAYNDLVCAKLASNLLQKNQQTFFIDLAKKTNQDGFQYKAIVGFLKDKLQANVIINNFQALSGTKIWFKEFLNFAKKYQISFFIFLDEIGFLFSSFYKKNNISHYFLPKLRFCEWIKKHHKINFVNSETYKEFLKDFLNLNQKTGFDETIAKNLALKIEKILHHDVYDLYKKKFSIHLCLKLLRYIVYANTPLFDLIALSNSLGIDYFDLKEIIEILTTTKIIKTLRLVNKNLKKVNLNYYYIVFCDPINYYGFEGFNFQDYHLDQDLKLWTSILVNTYEQFSELQVVQDLYVPLNEQIGIYDPVKKAFLQMGKNHSSVGPLLIHLKNLNIKKTYYLGLYQLINFMTNWQLKNLTNYKIN